MMGGQQVANLKKLDPDDLVTSITYCRDTYRVTTAAGEVHELLERNLRFKTESSEDGPEKGAPAIVGAGMMGDRADVIFAAPEEIGAFVKPGCCQRRPAGGALPSSDATALTALILPGAARASAPWSRRR